MGQIPLKLHVAEEQEEILSEVTGDELALSLDLRPFMQRTPFVIQV